MWALGSFIFFGVLFLSLSLPLSPQTHPWVIPKGLNFGDRKDHKYECYVCLFFSQKFGICDVSKSLKNLQSLLLNMIGTKPP
jgi:hypothetical protein